MLLHYGFFVPLVVIAMYGCGIDNTEEIATLQRQVAALTRQVEDAHEKIGTLRDSNQEMNKMLGDLTTQLQRVQQRTASPLPAPAVEPREERVEQPAPPPSPAAQVSCSQIWRLLGQGRDAETVARTLNTTLETVQSCDQQVGRGGAR